MNKIFFLITLFFSMSALANLPIGEFDGITNRGQACYYSFNGQKLVFGYMPDDRPWEYCQVSEERISSSTESIKAKGKNCSGEFFLDKKMAIMTFNESVGPYKIIRCRNLR